MSRDLPPLLAIAGLALIWIVLRVIGAAQALPYNIIWVLDTLSGITVLLMIITVALEWEPKMLVRMVLDALLPLQALLLPFSTYKLWKLRKREKGLRKQIASG